VLYKFKSKAGADVIMLAAHGDQALSALGRSPSPTGIFQQSELAGLIAQGEAAIAEEQQSLDRTGAARADDDTPDDEPKAPKRPDVTLRQRLWPLLELMRAAQAAHTDVVWGI
jgi:Domain of unknown function (DUF1840)